MMNILPSLVCAVLDLNSGLFAMLAIFAMQLIQFALSSYFIKAHSAKDRKVAEEADSEINLNIGQNCLRIHEHEKATTGEDDVDSKDSKQNLLVKARETKMQKRTTVALLEAGIGTYSFILIISHSLYYHWLCSWCQLGKRIHRFFDRTVLPSVL
jgi:hypothetical protein